MTLPVLDELGLVERALLHNHDADIPNLEVGARDEGERELPLQHLRLCQRRVVEATVADASPGCRGGRCRGGRTVFRAGCRRGHVVVGDPLGGAGEGNFLDGAAKFGIGRKGRKAVVLENKKGNSRSEKKILLVR